MLQRFRQSPTWYRWRRVLSWSGRNGVNVTVRGEDARAQDVFNANLGGYSQGSGTTYATRFTR